MIGIAGPGFLLDIAREARIGLPEAVFCAGKTPDQVAAIVEAAPGALLLTRLDAARHVLLPDDVRARLDYDALSATAILGARPGPVRSGLVAIVSAGTSDLAVAREAERTLRFSGLAALSVDDVGVAGLWRLLDRIEELRRMPIVIVAAGMDAALPSVLAGLVAGAVIAVPTSVGYGVASGGETALHSVLASCAPGITVVNIDNGYGAACAALRIARLLPEESHGTS